MSKRGPKPKHAKVREMEGNPARRPIPSGYVEPDEAPTRAEHLTGYAREVWDRVLAVMPEGVYSASDEGTLVAYCLACDQHRRAWQHLEIEGHVLYPPEGKAYRNPWSAVLNEAVNQISRLGGQLGLNPIARMAIPASEKKPVSKFDGLIAIDGGKAG